MAAGEGPISCWTNSWKLQNEPVLRALGGGWPNLMGCRSAVLGFFVLSAQKPQKATDFSYTTKMEADESHQGQGSPRSANSSADSWVFLCLGATAVPWGATEATDVWDLALMFLMSMSDGKQQPSLSLLSMKRKNVATKGANLNPV